MVISDEQGRAAAACLKSASPTVQCLSHPEISPAILDAARAIVDSTPELRPERVAAAIDHLGTGNPDSRDVACKMISRIISDSLR